MLPSIMWRALKARIVTINDKGMDVEAVSNQVASQIEFMRFWNKFRKRIMKRNSNSPRSYD